MSKKYIKEACVESLAQAIKAEEKGADRLELCAYLAFDGLTPAPDLISEVIKAVKIPVRVMIRPRNGDFNYSEEELEHMKACIAFCKKEGAEGVVFGVLNGFFFAEDDRGVFLVFLALPRFNFVGVFFLLLLGVFTSFLLVLVLLVFFLTFLVALFFKPSNATAISSAGLAGVDAVAFLVSLRVGLFVRAILFYIFFLSN